MHRRLEILFRVVPVIYFRNPLGFLTSYFHMDVPSTCVDIWKSKFFVILNSVAFLHSWPHHLLQSGRRVGEMKWVLLLSRDMLQFGVKSHQEVVFVFWSICNNTYYVYAFTSKTRSKASQSIFLKISDENVTRIWRSTK